MQRLLIMWLEKENPVLLFPLISLSQNDLCMPPLLPEEMQCMFFGLSKKPNHRVNLSVWRTIKNVFGWKWTNPILLSGLFGYFYFLSFCQLLTSWRACTEHGYKKKEKNKRLSYRSRHSQSVLSSPVLIHSSRLTHWTKLSVGYFF